ncbi:hypothetical protein G3I59_25455 [Amycolatopsis rubida]|uniref:Uncharacterized protein n=1 Tax=Amycolatopsis rubida TaxID=112413 RepID=A0ABX0BTA8_9PSEU|nr:MULTISPECIES: hypothetical protein [Amycolatopsis]MYW93863.1 hypothetical protein [Amycolatopsis rubida]NEC58852.1 hypothetical protein [Amycolatopsis rubida]
MRDELGPQRPPILLGEQPVRTGPARRAPHPAALPALRAQRGLVPLAAAGHRSLVEDPEECRPPFRTEIRLRGKESIELDRIEDGILSENHRRHEPVRGSGTP